MLNQNPEQLARDEIDKQLLASGWIVQNKNQINLNAGIGVAVREYQTDISPADYVLFVDKKLVAIIKAKRAEEGVHLTMHTTSINSNIINKIDEDSKHNIWIGGQRDMGIYNP